MPSKKPAQHAQHRARGKREATAERPSHEPRSQWSGTLSFGLVSIPVDLYSATRAGGVALRLLAEDGTPLARRFYCPEDGHAVDGEHLARGYEYSKGQYVVVSDEELESLQPEKSRDIDLRLFVAQAELDPAYFDRSFFLAPSGDSNKAYRLLTSVMAGHELAGIATFVMREREYLVAILAEDGMLRAQSLRFAGEVRSAEGIAPSADSKRVAASDVEFFTKVIRKHARADVDLEALHDQHADAIRVLAEKKAHSKKELVRSPVAEEAHQDAEILDLMDVLKRSLDPGKHGAKHGASSLKHSLKGKR